MGGRSSLLLSMLWFQLFLNIVGSHFIKWVLCGCKALKWKKYIFGLRSTVPTAAPPPPHNNKHLNSENFWMHGIMVKIWSTGFVVHTHLAFWESKIGVIKRAVHEIPCPWRLMDLMNKKERTETVQLPPILLFLILWQLKIKCPLTQILSSGISALGKTKQRSGGPHVCSVS